MTDFLLELRAEEIPARMQAKAKADLARLFADAIGKAGLTATEIETFATPRRLALIARALPDATSAVCEEIKGPKTAAPPQALEGFLRKTGLTRAQLIERDGVFFAMIDTPGRATSEVLAEAIVAIVRAFPWPRSMRWGAASASTESLRWVRPLQGIVALFGGDVVTCAVDGIVSGATTTGHRFHHSGAVTIGSADDYVEKLRAAHVIVHLSERRTLIADGAARAAAAAGLTVIADDGLVLENAGLTEWPVPLLGRFDAAFLDVPREVIQLTMRTNQKYFACADSAGQLANAFICTANIDASDGGAAIVTGNERVLSARLADAKFFWENDLRVPLAVQAEKLSQIVFHEKLGTVADKVVRVAKLARWLCEEGIVAGNPDLAERAARLCKADLVTGMVGEFPELQGVIGGYVAAAQGEHPAVAAAIRDHYKPVGQGDEVPTDPVTVAVSLADKLDSLVFFYAMETPTGSKDPFAVRRMVIGVLQLLAHNGVRVSLAAAIARATRPFQQAEASVAGRINMMSGVIPEFAIDRLKVQQREAGVRHDLIDAVFALGGEDDLVRLLARVKALQAFVGTDEGANLLAGYKRAANILKKAGVASTTTAVTPAKAGVHGLAGAASDNGSARVGMDPGLRRGDGSKVGGEGAETVLTAALDTAEPTAQAAIAAEDFAAAMSALASLRAPIDAFFEGVMVNDPDPAVREHRLALLARFRDAVHTVADFSKIEG